MRGWGSGALATPPLSIPFPGDDWAANVTALRSVAMKQVHVWWTGDGFSRPLGKAPELGRVDRLSHSL